MTRIVRKYPVVSACLAIIVVSLAVLVLLGGVTPLAVFAFVPLFLASLVLTIISNIRVFGAKANSTIYRPGADNDS